MHERFYEFIEKHLGPDHLLITCGLPATYKTETSEEISKLKDYKILRTDLIRLKVLKNEDIFNEKVAANMNKRTMVYDEMFNQTVDLIQKGSGVILDATFVTNSLRFRAAEIAEKFNKKLIILQTSCPQKVSIRRILQRTKENYESNALTEQAYINNKKKFEPVDLDFLKNKYPNLSILHFTVDTSEDQPNRWFVVDQATR